MLRDIFLRFVIIVIFEGEKLLVLTVKLYIL